MAQQLSDKAQTAIDRGDYEQAKQELLQLVSVEPKSAEAHHRLARVLLLQHRVNEAEACYQIALKFDPDYVGAMIGLGEIEAGRGDHTAALKRFESAIEIEPHNADAHFAQGRLLESLGRTDEALAALFRTLEFNPIHPLAGQHIAAIQLARNQPDQALARLDQAVELAPGNVDTRFLRGRAHLALRHIPQAIADFKTVAVERPDRAEVYYHLALAYEAVHRSKDALQAAEQALRLAPDHADARQLTERLRR